MDNIFRVNEGQIMFDEKEMDSSIIPIGKEVAIFRTLLNFTQKQFADLLLLSRVSISKLEQSKDTEALTLDVAFRLYYATQKILENNNKEEYIKEQARTLQQRIDETIKNRMKS